MLAVVMIAVPAAPPVVALEIRPVNLRLAEVTVPDASKMPPWLPMEKRRFVD